MLIYKPKLNTLTEQSFAIGDCTLKMGEHRSEIIHSNGNGYSITVREAQVLKRLVHSEDEVITKQALIHGATRKRLAPTHCRWPFLI